MNFWAYGPKFEEGKMSTLLERSPLVREAYEEYLRFSLDPEKQEQARSRRRFVDEMHLNYNEAEGEAKNGI
jgi:hypothetical protein